MTIWIACTRSFFRSNLARKTPKVFHAKESVCFVGLSETTLESNVKHL